MDFLQIQLVVCARLSLLIVRAFTVVVLMARVISRVKTVHYNYRCYHLIRDISCKGRRLNVLQGHVRIIKEVRGRSGRPV